MFRLVRLTVMELVAVVVVIALAIQTTRAIRVVPSLMEEERRLREQDVDRSWPPPPADDSAHHSNNPQRRLNSPESEARSLKPNNPDKHLIQEPLPLWKGDAFATRHWSGHLPASEKDDKYFFYWLFEPAEQTQDDIPLLIWLNGGPGCSSMDGLFLENGPFRLDSDGDAHFVTVRNASWHKAPAYTLYIDQPVGTGLSFTKSGNYPRNDDQVNVDFYHFLQSFLKLHSDKFVDDNNKMNRKVFFSGESHAGHYIPHMVRYILEQNDENSNTHIDLGGAAIGNGWTDPYYQYASAEAAYGHGLVGQAQVNALAEDEETCQKYLKQGDYRERVCFGLLDNVVAESYGASSPYKVSQYNVDFSENKHESRHFPPRHKVLETYLGGWDLRDTSDGSMSSDIYHKVLKTIHATAATDNGQRYKECTDPPYNALSHQDGKGVVDDVIQVLDGHKEVRLLFFNGMNDLICNHVGNEKWLTHMQWKGREKWIEASRYAWTSDYDSQTNTRKVSGYMKEYENLQFLKLPGAGHMVPMDIPETSLEMMAQFLKGESFQASRQDLGTRTALPSQQQQQCPVCAECPGVGNWVLNETDSRQNATQESANDSD